MEKNFAPPLEKILGEPLDTVICLYHTFMHVGNITICILVQTALYNYMHLDQRREPRAIVRAVNMQLAFYKPNRVVTTYHCKVTTYSD